MSYYVVIDLEMCRVPKGMKKTYHYKHEIIQIGAALMNDEYEVIDKYCTYVKPEFGCLDSFIRRLTGITDSDLKNAPMIKEALNEFLMWLPDDDITAISWSDSDRYQLLHELGEKRIKISGVLENMLDTWIDCQPEFSMKMKANKLYSLEEALIATDICTDGRAHNGLDDAYNTALLYAKMKRENELVLNEYYENAHNGKEEGLSFNLGDLLTAAGF